MKQIGIGESIKMKVVCQDSDMVSYNESGFQYIDQKMYPDIVIYYFTEFKLKLIQY
jgi:hypothetical protein